MKQRVENIEDSIRVLSNANNVPLTEIALLKQAIIGIEKWKELIHVKAGETHNDLNLLRLEMQHMSTDQKEVKEVIKSNTIALNSIEKVLNELLVAKKTTESNIINTGKIILWAGSAASVFYAGYNFIKYWWKS